MTFLCHSVKTQRSAESVQLAKRPHPAAPALALGVWGVVPEEEPWGRAPVKQASAGLTTEKPHTGTTGNGLPRQVRTLAGQRARPSAAAPASLSTAPTQCWPHSPWLLWGPWLCGGLWLHLSLWSSWGPRSCWSPRHFRKFQA